MENTLHHIEVRLFFCGKDKPKLTAYSHIMIMI